MQKINLIPQFFEKLKFKKSCNPIGGEHFGPLLENQIFPRHLVLRKLYTQLWGIIWNIKSNADLVKMPNNLHLAQICLVYLII